MSSIGGMKQAAPGLNSESTSPSYIASSRSFVGVRGTIAVLALPYDEATG